MCFIKNKALTILSVLKVKATQMAHFVLLLTTHTRRLLSDQPCLDLLKNFIDVKTRSSNENQFEKLNSSVQVYF
jgi:hypothetical protein